MIWYVLGFLLTAAEAIAAFSKGVLFALELLERWHESER